MSNAGKDFCARNKGIWLEDNKEILKSSFKILDKFILEETEFKLSKDEYSALETFYKIHHCPHCSQWGLDMLSKASVVE